MKVEVKVTKEVGTPREFLCFKTPYAVVRLPTDLDPLRKQLDELKEKHEPWEFFLDAEIMRKVKHLVPGVGQVKKDGWELGHYLEGYESSIVSIREAILEKMGFDPKAKQQQLEPKEPKSKKK